MTIIKKFETAEPKKRLAKKYIILTAACLLILVMVEIWASNTVVTYGERFQRLSSLEKILISENQILENEISKHTALISIASKSAQLGFIKTQSIQYIR